MKTVFRIDGIMVVAVLAVAGIAYAYFKRKDIANALNPASTENIIYDNFVGGIGRQLTGDPHWSLGGQIYDWVN